MIKFKKVLQFKVVSLATVLVFSLNMLSYGIGLSEESHLRAPLLFGKGNGIKRRALVVSAAATLALGAMSNQTVSAQSRDAMLSSIRDDILSLYAVEKEKKENAAARLLGFASRNSSFMASLLEFLIEEGLRAEAAGIKSGSIFSEMLKQLLQNQYVPGMLFNIFKEGINHRVRARAIIFFGGIYMGNERMLVTNYDLPFLYNALIDPDMRYAGQTILTYSVKRNPALKDVVIKELLAMRELAEIRNNSQAIDFLDEALGDIAKTSDLLKMLGGFSYNIQIQAMKRLAKAKDLSSIGLEYDTRYIISNFLKYEETQELAITILTKIAPMEEAFLKTLLGESLITDVFEDGKASEMLLGPIRGTVNQAQGLRVFFGILSMYRPAIIPKLLAAIAMAGDEALGKIEFGGDRQEYESGVIVEDIATSIGRVEQLIDFSMYPQYRDKALYILSRIYLTNQGLDKILDKIKERYPDVEKKRQELHQSANGVDNLLEEIKKTHPDIDKKRRDFMGKLAKAIKEPGASEEEARIYLDAILGWGKKITGEKFLGYRALGLRVDISDLFALFYNPDYRDIKPQVFKKISAAEDFIYVETNPGFIRTCIDNLKDPALQEASAHILAGIQIDSPRLRLYLIEILLELRNKGVEIHETENIVNRQINTLLEGKSNAEAQEILAGLLRAGNGDSIRIETIKYLADMPDINLSLFRSRIFFHTAIADALEKYPEAKDSASKLLRASGMEAGKVKELAEKAEDKHKIPFKRQNRKGDLIDQLFDRYGTSVDILRAACETKDYKVRYQALSILSEIEDLNIAFKAVPIGFEILAGFLGDSGLRDMILNKIFTKLTDPYLKRIASGFLLEKAPSLFYPQDIVTILEQEGQGDPFIRRAALNMIAGKDLSNIQARYETAQILVNALNDLSTRETAERILKDFRIGTLGLRLQIVRALIEEKLITDVKDEYKVRDLLVSILKSIASHEDGRKILLEIIKNDINPMITREAENILGESGDYKAMAFNVQGRETSTRFSSLRAALSSI